MQKYAIAQLRPCDLHCNVNMKHNVQKRSRCGKYNQKYALLQPIANHTNGKKLSQHVSSQPYGQQKAKTLFSCSFSLGKQIGMLCVSVIIVTIRS